MLLDHKLASLWLYRDDLVIRSWVGIAALLASCVAKMPKVCIIPLELATAFGAGGKI